MRPVRKLTSRPLKMIIMMTALTAIVTAMVTMISGCISMGRNRSDNLISEREIRVPESYTRAHKIKVGESHKSLELILDLTVKTGSFSWRVLDPEGEERWSSSVSAGSRFKKTTPFDPILGEWIVEVNAVGVTGRLKLIWQTYRD